MPLSSRRPNKDKGVMTNAVRYRLFMKLWSVVVVVALHVGNCRAVAIDNEVVGDPTVVCTEDGVAIHLNTRNPFTGRMFVKDESSKVECNSQGRMFDPTRPSLAVSFDQCGMFRERMLNPRGMMYSLTVLISFHPLFITKVDRAYKLKCFYGEATKMLTQSLDVSALTTEALTSAVDMPSCTYSIRSDSLDGPRIAYANVGDKVVHRWDCDTDMYRFLVRNCYVEETKAQQRVSVIDDIGCAVDPVVLGDVRYDATRAIAYAESHQFKFADVSRMYFTCQIQICMAVDSSCLGITPPRCPLSVQAAPSQQERQQQQQQQYQQVLPVTSVRRQAVQLAPSNLPPGLLARWRVRRNATRRAHTPIAHTHNDGVAESKHDDEDQNLLDVRSESVTVFDIDQQPVPTPPTFSTSHEYARRAVANHLLRPPTQQNRHVVTAPPNLQRTLVPDYNSGEHSCDCNQWINMLIVTFLLCLFLAILASCLALVRFRPQKS